MRLFTSGFAPLTEQTHHAFHSRTGHKILERYGMTEAGIITSNPLHGDRIPGYVGFCFYLGFKCAFRMTVESVIRAR